MCSVQAFIEEVQSVFPKEIRPNPQEINLLALGRWSLFELSPQVHGLKFVRPRCSTRYRERSQNDNNPVPMHYHQSVPRSILNRKERILEDFQGEQFKLSQELLFRSTHEIPLVKDFHKRIAWYLRFASQVDYEPAWERKDEIWEILEWYEEDGNLLQFQDASGRSW